MEKLIVALPSTFTCIENRKLRTYLIGKLARYLAIFKVTHVFIYYDPDPRFNSHGLGKYITKVLKHCITPPYLKKYATPYKSEYREFGLLHPLQIKSHLEKRPTGQFNWGVVNKNLELIFFRGSKLLKSKINKEELKSKGYSLNLPQLVVLKNYKLCSPLELGRKYYLGFWVRYFNKGLKEVIEFSKANFKPLFVIATSRQGKFVFELKNIIKTQLRKNWMVLFGGHHRGLLQLGKKEWYDIIINLFKDQETKTIRTEEAIPLVLQALADISP